MRAYPCRSANAPSGLPPALVQWPRPNRRGEGPIVGVRVGLTILLAASALLSRGSGGLARRRVSRAGGSRADVERPEDHRSPLRVSGALAPSARSWKCLGTGRRLNRASGSKFQASGFLWGRAGSASPYRLAPAAVMLPDNASTWMPWKRA